MRFALFVLLFAWNSHGQQSERMAVASNAHACELFQYFRQMTDGNFCFSPFSSHQIAALLTAAANGETQKEIAAAEEDFPAKHLIGQNIANGAQEMKETSPLVWILNFHYAHPPDAVAQN